MPLHPAADPCCTETRAAEAQDTPSPVSPPQETCPGTDLPREAESDLNGQAWFIALAAQVRAQGGSWQGALLDLIMGDPQEPPEPANTRSAAEIEPLQPGLLQAAWHRPAAARTRGSCRPGSRPRHR